MALFRKKIDVEPDDPAELTQELSVINTILAGYPAGARLSFGAPTRCPDCGNYGFVQNVNHATGRCTTSCLACHVTWVITERALRAHAVAVADRPIPAPTLDRPFHASAEFSPMPERTNLPPAQRPESTVETVTFPAPGSLPASPLVEVSPAPDTTPLAGPDDLPAPAPAPVAETPAPAASVPPAATELQPVIDLDRPSLRVLVVEDNPFDLATLETLLEPYDSSEIVVTHAATRAEGQKRVLAGDFDVVLLDLDLPDSKGITTVLEWNHEVNLDIPVIATAADAGADLIQQVRSLGVIHVVLKPHLDELAAKGGTGSRQLLKLLRTTAQRRAQVAPTTSF